MHSCSSNTINLSSSESNQYPSNSNFVLPAVGTCYGKGRIQAEFQIEILIIPIYTGNRAIEEIDIDTVEIILNPRFKNWEKTKKIKNCISENSQDCMTWQLYEHPEYSKIFHVLQDTSQSSNYEWTEVEKVKLLKNGRSTEWIEVFCDSEITKDLLLDITRTLYKLGYIKSININNLLEPIHKEALIKYQIDHNLQIGVVLSIETLKSLGVI